MQTKTRLGSRVKAMMAHHIVKELGLADLEEEFGSDWCGREIKIDNSFDLEEYPEWRFVGIGGTRVCLMNENVVYKIDIGYLRENASEYSHYQAMQDRLINGWVSDLFRVAECELIEFVHRGLPVSVIAMEYVDGNYVDPELADEIEYLVQSQFDIQDTYCGNIKYDSYGDPVLIDFSR